MKIEEFPVNVVLGNPLEKLKVISVIYPGAAYFFVKIILEFSKIPFSPEIIKFVNY